MKFDVKMMIINSKKEGGGEGGGEITVKDLQEMTRYHFQSNCTALSLSRVRLHLGQHRCTAINKIVKRKKKKKFIERMQRKSID